MPGPHLLGRLCAAALRPLANGDELVKQLVSTHARIGAWFSYLPPRLCDHPCVFPHGGRVDHLLGIHLGIGPNDHLFGNRVHQILSVDLARSFKLSADSDHVDRVGPVLNLQDGGKDFLVCRFREVLRQKAFIASVTTRHNGAQGRPLSLDIVVV